MQPRIPRSLLIAASCFAAGCVSPRAAHVPPSMPDASLTDPQSTTWGKKFAVAEAARPELSGLRVLAMGIDGIAARVQIARQAERSLDLQYFIYRDDSTGSLLTAELRKAAERGVRVRVLVDDGDTATGDENVLRLDGYRGIEVRVFNPFGYRGHNRLLRNLDFVLHKSRLDYRMHNKLMIADDTVALVGGRNVGDQYFQVDPESQFADDDVFTVGAAVHALRHSFQDFWSSDLVVRASQLRMPSSNRSHAPAELQHAVLARIDSGEPLRSMAAPEQLTWAVGTVIYDSPDKRRVERREHSGRLMSGTVEREIDQVSRDLEIVSPYFVPSVHELQVLQDASDRGARVRILTNSLESTPEVAAHSGYVKTRTPLLRAGVRLFETRALLESVQGSGEGRQIARYGNYALHGKMYVFDERRVLIGSWNYDQRSLRLNTEIGLLIESPDVVRQVRHRIDTMLEPTAAYQVIFKSDSSGHERLAWRTTRDGKNYELASEPSRGRWRRFKAWCLSLLPLEPEL